MRETLGQYVARIMREKNLKPEEVRKLAGGKITDGYVRSIVAERAKNPSVKKLQALARGLNVSEDHLFRVARGLPPQGFNEDDEPNYAEIINLVHASLKNRTLGLLLQEAARLSPESMELAVAVLKMLNERMEQSARQKSA